MKQSLRARMGVLCGAAVMMCSSMAVGQPYSYETLEVLEPAGLSGRWFGYGTAVGGGYLAASANASGVPLNTGYVYMFDAGEGSFLFEVRGPGVTEHDNFGYSLAIQGSKLAVGAPTDGDASGIGGSGTVYLFNLSDGAYIRRYTASDAAGGDSFGIDVAMTDSALVAGAPYDVVGGIRKGSAYAFSLQSGSQLRKFSPADGTEDGKFGWALAVTESYLAVSSPWLDTSLGRTGAVYIYSYFDGHLIHKLEADDPLDEQNFGLDVAILGDRIYVGAPYDDERGPYAGAVYVFDAVSGDQLTKILPPEVDPVPNRGVQLGSKLAVDEHMLMVVASHDDEAAMDAGAVYLYDPVTYEFLSKVVVPDGMTGDTLGRSIAAGDRQYAVGAIARDSQGPSSGSVFIITQNCRPDVNDDSLVDFFDVSTLVNARIDYNGDGVFNFFDVSAFLSDFQIGCP